MGKVAEEELVEEHVDRPTPHQRRRPAVRFLGSPREGGAGEPDPRIRHRVGVAVRPFVPETGDLEGGELHRRHRDQLRRPREHPGRQLHGPGLWCGRH